MINLKPGFAILIVILTSTLVGCGIAGSPNKPVIDDSVTLTAKVAPPAVNSDNLLGSAKYNSTQMIDLISQRGVCQVNGNEVEFSLNATDAELIVENIPPEDAYEIALMCGDLSLMAIVPYQGRKTVFPDGISLTTTADWQLRKMYSQHLALSTHAFAQYQSSVTDISKIETAMKNELAKSNSDKDSFDNAINTVLNQIKNQKSFSQAFSYGKNNFDFNGDWSGKVYYYLHNSAGHKALIVEAQAEMTVYCSGSTLSGSLSMVPAGVAPLLDNLSGISEPSEIAFSFRGTCNSNVAEFTRQGNLGPVAGKDIDQWQIFPVNKGIAVRAVNLDAAYNTGLETLPGDFILVEASTP